MLKVHPSNYRIDGFTASAGIGELAGLGVPVVGDIGSGLLAPHPALPDEPDAATWLRAGADLVTASGDKLLGGPQAGLLLGRADLVRQLARHPLARALRVDKLTVAALEATLAGPEPPVLHALSADPLELTRRAERLAGVLAAAGVDARPVASQAAVGGGGAPGVTLGSAAISLPGFLAVPLRRRRAGAVRTPASRRGPGQRGQAAARPVRGRAGRRRHAGRRRCSQPPDGTDAAMHVIATAGHVDHGKSALLRALTGMEPDRWAEEQRRGLTIDLGYAWMRLASGEQLAFVDVPGHARFIPNMLAGVGPVPAVLFVVAADGGWMPQSAEHLAAIDALGISRGLLAVTRADLADPGPAMAQAAAQIRRSSLGAVRAVAVSAVTGAACPSW